MALSKGKKEGCGVGEPWLAKGGGLGPFSRSVWFTKEHLHQRFGSPKMTFHSGSHFSDILFSKPSPARTLPLGNLGLPRACHGFIII